MVKEPNCNGLPRYGGSGGLGLSPRILLSEWISGAKILGDYGDAGVFYYFEQWQASKLIFVVLMGRLQGEEDEMP